MQWLCTTNAAEPIILTGFQHVASGVQGDEKSDTIIWILWVCRVLTMLTVLSCYVHKQGLHKPQVGPYRETLRCLVPEKQDDSWGFVTVSKIEPTPRPWLLDKLDLGLLQLDRSGIAWLWQIAPIWVTGLEPWFLVSVTAFNQFTSHLFGL